MIMKNLIIQINAAWIKLTYLKKGSLRKSKMVLRMKIYYS